MIDRKGAAYVAPDLVNLVNDKTQGFIFTTAGKLGPGESGLVLRGIAEYIVDGNAACHIEERRIEQQ